MKSPKISIVTDSYNQAEYLEDCIKSVVDQNYPNLEYIIYDGGSTDGSVEIIKKYADKISYWQSCPDGGQVKALNDAIERSTGEIIGVLDSDDMLCLGSLDAIGHFFASNPDNDWVVGSGRMCTKGAKDIILKPVSIDFDALLKRWGENILCQPSVFWKRSLWNKIGGFDEFYKLSFDYELFLRLAKNGNGAKIDDCISIHNRHIEQKTQATDHEGFVETSLAMFAHGAREEAFQCLNRVCKHTFDFSKKMSFITNNKLYKKWRNAKENNKQIDRK